MNRSEQLMIDVADYTYKKIHEFGSENQMIVAIEELSELQKELTKVIRKKGIRKNVLEELSDVQLMLLQIKHLFSFSDSEIEEQIRYKMNRES